LPPSNLTPTIRYQSTNTTATQPQNLGPPYPPSGQAIGGIPTWPVDGAISIALIPLFVLAAVAHFLCFFTNRRRPKRRSNPKPPRKFIFSFITGIFCVVRIAALSLRIAWARNHTNARVALAATVFVAAGVLILYVVNLFLMGRVVRALHPAFGWSKCALWGFRILVATLVGMLVMVVTCSVHSMFTLDVDARRKERDVLLFAGVYMTVLAFAPAVAVVLAKVVPNRGEHPAENFGKGSMWVKMVLLVFTSVLLAFGAGFRAAVNFEAKPLGQVEWYHHTAVFYCINFVIELIVVYTYAIFRFDQKFYVPDSASGPGDYSRASQEPQEEAQEEDQEGGYELADRTGASGDSVRTESLRDKDGTGDESHSRAYGQ
jgi:MFS family permease